MKRVQRARKPAFGTKTRPSGPERSRKPVSASEPSFTHLDKVFWPEEGYTKGDLVAYYEQIAPTILPYLKDRPENMNRHPNGIKGKNFFQKNVTNELPPFASSERIWSESNGEYLRYLVCDNKETLLYMANLGCIELNPWTSRVERLHHPDFLILDLDPHGRSFDELVTVTKEVKRVLDLACEESYVKTSGKSGIHVAVPLGARYTYAQSRTFAKLVMELVHEKLPDLTSMERNPKKRGGKIYLDYLQNNFGQTLAAAYAVRPYPGATVSTPLEWREVRTGLDPAKFTIKTIFARLKKKGDLWKGVLGKGVELRDAIRCLEEHRS